MIDLDLDGLVDPEKRCFGKPRTPAPLQPLAPCPQPTLNPPPSPHHVPFRHFPLPPAPIPLPCALGHSTCPSIGPPSAGAGAYARQQRIVVPTCSRYRHRCLTRTNLRARSSRPGPRLGGARLRNLRLHRPRKSTIPFGAEAARQPHHRRPRRTLPCAPAGVTIECDEPAPHHRPI